MITLLDCVLAADIFDCNKHGLHDCPQTYAESKIMQMNNMELVQKLSDAMEDFITLNKLEKR